MFIDWITISQKHDISKNQAIKQLSGNRVLCVSPHGEVEWFTDKPFKHEGSYDTRIAIRALGNEVTLSGNIGAFDRPDNVFGYGLDELILKANNLLSEFDLPPFTKGEQYLVQPLRQSDVFARMIYTGATISRLDLTDNYETGSAEQAAEYLYYLSTIKSTRMRTTARGDTDTIQTVVHGESSRYRSAIIYNKAEEFKKHKRQYLSDTYHNDLYNHMNECGYIRFELRLKQRYLTQNSLRYLGLVTMERLENIYTESAEKIIKQVDISRLVDLSAQARNSYRDWRDGVMLQKTRTFYRHRREILDKLGVDIAMQYKNNAVQSPKTRAIKATLAKPPEGYCLPRIA